MDFDSKLEQLSVDNKESTKLNVVNTNNQKQSIITDIIFMIINGFATLVILGAMSLFDGKFSISVYGTWDFWVNYLSLQFATLSIRLTIKGINDKIQTKTNESYLITDKNLQEYIQKDFETPFIEEMAKIDDYKRKRFTYKNNLKRKMIKLNKKRKISNFIKNVNDAEQGLEIKELKLEKPKVSRVRLIHKINKKREIKHLRKFNQLLQQITPEYIKTNLKGLNVKYNKVSRSILTSGYSAKTDELLGERYDNNSKKIFLQQTIKTTLLVFIFMFFITTLRESTIKNNAGAWFEFLSKISMISISGTITWFNNKNLFESTTLSSLNKRLNRIKIYYEQHKTLTKQKD